MKLAREPASSRPKPCASLKKPHESCPFAAPCGPRRKKNDRGQRSAFPSETSRFALSILAHRGSALPWLVNDRAALRLRRMYNQSQAACSRTVSKNNLNAFAPFDIGRTIASTFLATRSFVFPDGSSSQQLQYSAREPDFSVFLFFSLPSRLITSRVLSTVPRSFSRFFWHSNQHVVVFV